MTREPRQVVAPERMRSAFSGILTRRQAAAINATDRRSQPHALRTNPARRGARLRRLKPRETVSGARRDRRDVGRLAREVDAAARKLAGLVEG